MSLNSVNIMGNLTRDPELKNLPSGKAVCNLSIANNRVYSKGGEKVTEVSYFDVEVWGVVAENCARYLKKGSGIIVEGRLRQDRWEKDGKTQSRVRITANNIHFLPKRDGGGQQRSEPEASSSSPNEALDAASPADIAWEE
ncbi:MAG: single-stranded DNA-binding protein [Candidatus Omnitrophica bacterium]|nr:single-stranded DNA-binding protein [Candidatus Omnitrophota bacterium]